jgi:hypothetical protein
MRRQSSALGRSLSALWLNDIEVIPYQTFMRPAVANPRQF